MRVTAFYSPFFVNCTQVQIFKTGVKKLKITVEYDFSSFCTNYAPPSFGMTGNRQRGSGPPFGACCTLHGGDRYGRHHQGGSHRGTTAPHAVGRFRMQVNNFTFF